MPDDIIGDVPNIGAHTILINYLGHLGYNPNTRGVCEGFVSMASKAILANDEDHFNERMDLMLELYNEAKENAKGDEQKLKELLLAPINAVKEKISKKIPLDKKEIMIAEIPAFCEGIELHQSTHKHLELFQTRPNGQDFENVAAITMPMKEDKNKVTISTLFVGSYKTEDLIDYLKSLQAAIEKTNIKENVMLRLASTNHGIGISYKNGKWQFIDANFELGSSGIIECQSIQEVAGKIAEGFSTTERINFATTIRLFQPLENNNNPAQDILSAWQATPEWQRIHRPASLDSFLEKDSQDINLFTLACKQGDPTFLKTYLPVSNDFSQHELNDLLSNALIANNPEVVDILLKAKADPGFSIKDKPMLFIYPLQQNMEHLDVLIKNGMDINIRDNDGLSLLHYAMNAPDGITKAEQLLKKGADINAMTSLGQTPLIQAALAGKTDFVRFLLEHHADPHISDRNNYSPLHYAVMAAGNREIVNLLVQHNADQFLVNAQELTPYQTMTLINKEVYENLDKEAGDQDSSKRHKLKVNINERNGESPLFSAVRNRDVVLTKELLKDSDPNARRKYDLMAPLHVAASTLYERNTDDLLIHLIKSGADINARDRLGRTPLLIACEACKSDDYFKIGMIDVLLKNGADPTIKDHSGKCPANLSLRHSDYSHLERLVPRYRHSEKQSIEDFLFKDAIETGNVNDFVKILNKTYYIPNREEKINQKNKDGNTALHLACKQGNIEAVRALLAESDINWSIPNNSGKTAFELAIISQRYNLTFLNELFEEICPLQHKKPLLRVAAEADNLNAFILLLNNGMNFDSEVTKNEDGTLVGNTTLHYLIENYKIRFLDCVRTTNLNFPLARNDNHMTPRDLIIKELDTFSKTESLCAMLTHDPEVQEVHHGLYYLILNHVRSCSFMDKPDLDEKNNAMISSTGKFTIAMFDEFIEYYLRMPNVDVNALDESGNTLLSYALEGAYFIDRSFVPDNIQRLLDHGADPSLTEQNNRVNPSNVALINELEKHRSKKIEKETVSTAKNLGLFAHTEKPPTPRMEGGNEHKI